MRKMVPLILTFFMYNLCYAQHISEFTSLTGEGQDSNFNLPSTHSFQIVFDESEFLNSLGFESLIWKGVNFDFTGYVPINSSSKSGYLSINSETAPGGVVVLDIEFDDLLGKWEVDQSKPVDFPLGFDSSKVFATISNCSGTVTPWGTVITCEETTSIETAVFCNDPNNAGSFKCQYFSERDNNGDGYDDFGWAIEIDPASKTVIDQSGDRPDKDKLWAMGNFKHENVVIHDNHRTVYQGADDTNGEGYLFKFVADVAQDLSSGKLYVYKEEVTAGTGRWILLDNTTKSERNSTLQQCAGVEATSFGGIEDVEISPLDGKVYFAVKRDGKVYRFTDSDPVSGTTVTNFETYVGGMSYEIKSGVIEPWGGGNDNLVFDDLGNLWVAQDGDLNNSDVNKRDYNYIWVVENGHTQSNPKVKIFARTPKKSEPTGLTFSPDYRYMFMSIQHPGGNDSDQTDAFGRPVSFNSDVALVISRNEYLGQDLTLEDQDIMISQYYHDNVSDSKWIEVKNISGNPIPAGTFFLDLYDNTSLQNMSTASPKASEPIPAMQAGEVLLFKNKETPSLPQGTHLGSAAQKQSDICNFEGNDMILITTTPGKRKYNNRKDILGQVPAGNWGSNTTLIRGGNSLELPQRDFDKSNWFELDSLDEVSLADPQQNIALGTHEKGPTTWDGSNWSAQEPDRTRITVIDGPYQGGTTDLRTFDLKVNSEAAFLFEDDTPGNNHNIVVYRNLEIETGGTFILGDTESLIIRDPVASISGEIQKIERSAFRNDAHDITYWSSPVQDEQIENVFINVDQKRIFYFDQKNHLAADPLDPSYWSVWVNYDSGKMEVAKGYAAEGPSLTTGEHEVIFTGKPNFGTITSELLDFENDANDRNDFNLIGNPYPAAIDIESFLKTNASDNTVIDGTVYLWTHATPVSGGQFSASDYVTYNFVGGASNVENMEVENKIASGQGFFVRAAQAAEVIFEPDMILEGSNDQFFKETGEKQRAEKDRIWLNLKASDNSFKQILIGFDKNATDQMDSGYDAIYLEGNQPIAFYSVLDDKKLSIQGFGPFTDQKEVKLGFNASLEGLNMSIELPRMEGTFRDQDILLLDDDKGIVHDLKASPYTFTYEGKGSFEDRFILVFNSTVLGLDEEMIIEDVKVYIKDQHLVIDARNVIQQIKVYDALGRLVLKEQAQSTYNELNLDRIKMGGFFIVELVDDQGKTLTRKMVKY